MSDEIRLEYRNEEHNRQQHHKRREPPEETQWAQVAEEAGQHEPDFKAISIRAQLALRTFTAWQIGYIDFGM
jgi:hypothetical protein